MSRLYIRLMTNFYTHRKTVRLRTSLGNDALWIPPRIWAYCAENQPDGDLSDYKPDELAMLIGYQGDATSMLQALKDCGLITSDGQIHDWDVHNGYHDKFSKRAKIAADARWKKEKEQKKEDTERGKGKVETSIASSMLRAFGFPATEAEAKSLCATQAIPEAFILDTWNKAMSRGGCDAKGLQISSFMHYVLTEYKYERERIAKNGTNQSTPIGRTKTDSEILKEALR